MQSRRSFSRRSITTCSCGSSRRASPCSSAFIQTGKDSGWRWEVSHPSFLFFNRTLAAALGAGAVLLTMLLTRQIAGDWGALLAGGVVAGLEFHIQQSAMVTADVPSSFFTLSAVALSISYLRSGRPGTLALAFLIAGLAGSTKYNQAVAVVAPMLAFFAGLPRHGHQPWLWVALIVLPVAGFLIGSPYALLDVPMYLHFAGWEAFHYKVAGQVRFTVEAGWPHVLLQLERMGRNVGPWVSLLALLGTALLALRKLGFAYLVFPLAYIAFFCSMRLDFHRNFVVVYPFVALFFAYGLARTWRWSRAHASLVRQQRVDVLLSAAVLLLGGLYLGRAAHSAWLAWNLPESRSAAMALTAQLAERHDFKRIGVAAELRVHRLDLLRVPAAEVLPLRELLAQREQFDALVVPQRLFETTARSEYLHAQMRALNRALPGTPILAEVAGGGTNPAHPSINPAIRVLGRIGTAQGEILRGRSAGDLEQAHIHDVDGQ
jgi:4-amino-4-deoxy-L-arabinose transferase-like glycosyltransferase